MEGVELIRFIDLVQVAAYMLSTRKPDQPKLPIWRIL
jgi:hypothetical protein